MSIADKLNALVAVKTALRTSINNKGGSIDDSTPFSEYSLAVDNISTGGSTAVSESVVNFYDFEGTLVASYDADEIAGLTELPEPPDHSTDEVPLTFEEWNWTLEEIKEYHADMPEATIIVGATYHPTDGKLHMIVETLVDNYLNPLQLSFQSEAQIDWGDGTSDSVSGGSDISHYYEQKGRYHVRATTTSTYFSITKSANLTPKEAYIPRAITDLHLAFSDCSILEKVIIPSSVTTLGTSYSVGAFDECYSLCAIIFPRSLTEISDYSMYQCRSLRVLSLPPTITGIRSSAFEQCYSLKKITIPKGLLSLGVSAFSYIGVTEISLPSSLTSISSSAFAYMVALRKINIPAGIRTLPTGVFTNCFALEQVELNEGLETIKLNAFNGVRALQTLTIPSTVTSIVNNAFYSSYCLPSVTVLATTPPTLGSGAFNNSSINKIYVPAESVEAYKSATNWADYASKIEAIPA